MKTCKCLLKMVWMLASFGIVISVNIMLCRMYMEGGYFDYLFSTKTIKSMCKKGTAIFSSVRGGEYF